MSIFNVTIEEVVEMKSILNKEIIKILKIHGILFSFY
jgi:hypothetical protein